MVKIVSWNINGIRSKSMDLFKKDGFNVNSNLGNMIIKYIPDIICFQETKCQYKNIDKFTWPKNASGDLLYPYMAWNCSTEKKGYSGVGIISKLPFKNHGSISSIGEDLQGRSQLLEFESFYLINVYTPNSGTKGEYRKIWDEKIAHFLTSANKLIKSVIYCGDLNVAAETKDIHSQKTWHDEKLPGVLNYEKKGFQNILAKGNMIDVWRYKNPDISNIYSWWNPRTFSRKTNKGWRIDYFLTKKSDAKYITRCEILTEIYGSDHCPIILEFATC